MIAFQRVKRYLGEEGTRRSQRIVDGGNWKLGRTVEKKHEEDLGWGDALITAVWEQPPRTAPQRRVRERARAATPRGPNGPSEPGRGNGGPDGGTAALRRWPRRADCRHASCWAARLLGAPQCHKFFSKRFQPSASSAAPRRARRAPRADVRRNRPGSAERSDRRRSKGRGCRPRERASPYGVITRQRCPVVRYICTPLHARDCSSLLSVRRNAMPCRSLQRHSRSLCANTKLCYVCSVNFTPFTSWQIAAAVALPPCRYCTAAADPRGMSCTRGVRVSATAF